MEPTLKVMKFGGTSLQDESRIVKAAGLAAEATKAGSVVVVASALGGVTNALTAVASAAARGDVGYRELLRALLERHLRIATAVSLPGERSKMEGRLAGLNHDLETVLLDVFRARDCSARRLDVVLSFGERASAAILSAALRAQAVVSEDHDARRFVITDRSFGEARVLIDKAEERIQDYFSSSELSGVPVVTGFIGATLDGDTTTLGRNSSDLTAALLAAALGARGLELWTDVDGVMTADPRMVQDAVPLRSIGYRFVPDLLRFGAKVVFPQTIQAVVARKIPVTVRNTLNPGFAGTVIEGEASPEQPVLGITSLRQLALVEVRMGNGGQVAALEPHVREVLAREGIPVTSILKDAKCLSLVTERAAVEKVRADLSEAFAVDLAGYQAAVASAVEPVSVVSVVPGSKSLDEDQLASTLNRLRTGGIDALAAGTEHGALRFVLPEEAEADAVRLAHKHFFQDSGDLYTLFLCGVGTVGAEVLSRLPRSNLVVGGICNSRRAALFEPATATPAPVGALKESTTPSHAIFDRAMESRNAIILDCTPSEDVASRYAELLSAGVSVVTANKALLAGDPERYSQAKEAARTGRGRLLFAATVGAGLPVIDFLRSLHKSGDHVISVEGCMSGTLSYLAEQLIREVPFSEAVREAHRLGLTEPDPRADLSGLDVARKVVILARESGIDLDLSRVATEGLLPLEFQTLSLTAFWDRIAELDASMADRVAELTRESPRLAYVGWFDREAAGAELRPVPEDHAAYNLRPSENVFVCRTEAYLETPLVIRGPGAGPAVTALAVLGDTLRIANGRV